MIVSFPESGLRMFAPFQRQHSNPINAAINSSSSINRENEELNVPIIRGRFVLQLCEVIAVFLLSTLLRRLISRAYSIKPFLQKKQRCSETLQVYLYSGQIRFCAI
ncbi:hypothetical protein CCR75_002924 [Bremia lactucae]|uniref:Uncharacterized protein n=1 Tax=Bremia lactucae TaxID=4779 RepID=A0A976FQU3_BRELC|nr:hypothetical protein CCR75_002924 [Bremia lactucae]